MKKRLDLLLVDLGFAKSRAQAQQLIKSELVSVGGRLQTKAGAEFQIDPPPAIVIQTSDLTRFVSRAGLKLQNALNKTGFDVRGLVALDIGISTGGFTDCLLQNGAARVVGVDVGHGQLDSSLKSDERIHHFESFNARELNAARLAPHAPEGGFDLIVADVSFISLSLILPAARPLLGPDGKLLALVKPQFEAGREHLGKTGVVTNPKAFEDVKKKIYKLSSDLSLIVEDYFESDPPGSDGNQEYFLWARTDGTRGGLRRDAKETHSD